MTDATANGHAPVDWEPRLGPFPLLDDVHELLGRYVAFPSEHAHVAVSLWVLHCHAIDAFDSTPRLALLSPEKGSGKTRTLEVIELVVPRPKLAVNMSAAALYRLVADDPPVLLLDEADTYLGLTIAKQHEDLRGLINAGHRRNATVYRAEVAGKTVRVVEFPAFAPCALAGIGDLPDTILDRAVIVAMKRRAPNEHVESFRERDARAQVGDLPDRLAQWAEGSVDELRDRRPEMPAGISDRAADVWEPLLAIADHAGDQWAGRARRAALELNAARARRDPSLGIRLLEDCRRIFTDRDADRIPTEELLASLTALDEAPWGDLRGKPLDARGLAARLRKYDVRPGDHRFDDTIRKGYRTEDFHDAWARYLTPVADVAHVAPPASQRGDNGHVAPTEDEGGYVTPPYVQNLSLLPPTTPLQGQQAQHDHDPEPAL